MNRMKWVLLLWGTTATLLHGQNKQQFNLNFDSGSSELREADRISLDSMVNWHQEGNLRGVEVKGHADAVGTDDANKLLSQKRALTVAAYLKSQGVPPRKIKLRAFGEAAPLANNARSPGRQINRRVEVVAWLEAETEKGLDQMPIVEVPKPPQLQQNEFLVRCDSANHFDGVCGVQLKVPAHAFDTCGHLTLRLQEFHRFQDVAANHVSTTAGDTALESAGMICLTAYMDGKQLKDIRAGIPVEVRIPADKFDPGMRLYFAENRPRKDRLQWQSSNREIPTFDSSENVYVFRTSDLGCINIDKPALSDSISDLPIAIKVRKRMLRVHYMYAQYSSRGTFGKGKRGEKRYILFGPEACGNEVVLQGSLSDKRRVYRINKRLPVKEKGNPLVEINGQTYRVIARVNRRAINGKDKFKSRSRYRGDEVGYRRSMVMGGMAQ